MPAVSIVDSERDLVCYVCLDNTGYFRISGSSGGFVAPMRRSATRDKIPFLPYSAAKMSGVFCLLNVPFQSGRFEDLFLWKLSTVNSC